MKSHWPLSILGIGISVAAYLAIGYFIPRENTASLIISFFLLFAPYLYWSFLKPLEHKQILWVGMAFRIILVFALPALTDDFYRFFWDGTLTINGLNPFDFLPTELPTDVLNETWLNDKLLGQLNSPEYYTIYPPLLQGIFAFSAFLSQGDILAFVILCKVINLGFDLLTWFALGKLLKELKLPANRLTIYFLNPMIIVELSGNLHYELAMVATLGMAFWFLLKRKMLLAGILLALSVSTKLYPIVLVPFFLLTGNVKQKVVFILGFGVAMAVLFLPIFGPLQIAHIRESINLYFATFEFNAGIYYLIRWLGFQAIGYNIIQWSGAALGFITLILIALIWRRNLKYPDLRNRLTSTAFVILAYYALATTVMPWYISGILAYSIFGTYRFPIAWSGLAILSYTAYTTPTVQENYGLIAVEYGLVFIMAITEFRRIRSKRNT